jgi:hypothetical protein
MEAAMATQVLDLTTQTWSTLDPAIIDGGSAVMYGPGKVMKSGTSWQYDGTPATGTTYVLDVNQTTPRWRETASMAFGRVFHNLTILPDGQVLVTGGERVVDPLDDGTSVFEAEMWSPDTEAWSTMASMRTPRLYHSSALLLPDGRVLVGGGGRFGTDHPNAEIYSPPYLFKGNRPLISSAPTTIQYGTNFAVQTPDVSRIAKVSLIRFGGVTHTFNFDQRFLPLSFQSSGGSLSIQAPADANLAPPGYYMLFIVDNNGIPSAAAIVRFPSPLEDTQPPTVAITSPANGSNVAGTITVSATASDNKGVAGVQFQVDGANVGIEDITNPYSISWNTTMVPNGTHILTAIARDAAGNSAMSAPVTVTISNSLDTTPPTTPTGVVATAVSASQIDISWIPSSDNIGVTGYRIFRDGSVITIVTTTNYSDTGRQPSTTYSYTIVSLDGAGNSSVQSDPPATATTPATNSGLVAAYGFNEGSGTSTSDATGKGHTGTVANAAWTPAGKFAGALSFNGTNGWVSVADANDLDLTTGMTLEAWLFPTAAASATTWRNVIIKERPGGETYNLYVDTNAHVPAAYVVKSASPNTPVSANGTAQVPLSAWTHLAATYNNSSLNLYVNGNLVRSVATSGALMTSTGVLRIGGNSLWGEFFQGIIDEVRIYNRALTQAEIQADMNTPVGGAPAPNTAPTITAIGNQATNEDTATGPIAFTVGDAEMAAGSLTLSGSSSNTTLVPNGNIVFGGSGANRTVMVTPAANQNGTASITVTVSDGQLSTARSFQLTVNAVNDTPTITGIANQTTTVGTVVGPLNFTVGDAEMAAGSLTLSGSSSNTTLVPNGNIVFGGSGASRTVTVTPAAGQTGTASITVTVSDSVLSTPTSFQLTVNLPSFGLVAAYSFNAGSGTTVADNSGNGHTGTISGATWSTQGKYGNALSFDGFNDWLTVADAPGLDLTTGMTLEAWVFPTAQGNNWRNVIIKERAGGEVYNLYSNIDAGVPVVYVIRASAPAVPLDAAGQTQIPLNTWTHMTATYDGSVLRLFVNGTQVGSRAVSGALLTSTGALRIGGNSIWGEFFQGRIDEIRIYNRALAQMEIQTDMNTPISP